MQVAVSVPQTHGIFDYHLPVELDETVMIGHLVVVPFGKQTVQGVVLRRMEASSVVETRPVLRLVDPQAVLTPQQMALAQTLADQTLTPLSSCIELMLPPGLAQHADSVYRLRSGSDATASSDLNPIQEKLIRLLDRREELRGAQIDFALPHTNWRPAMRSLMKRGLVTAESVLSAPRIRPKFVRIAQLACSLAQAQQAMPALARANSAALARRQTILRYLIQEVGPVEVAWLYAESGGNLQDLYALADRELIQLSESEVWRDPLEQYTFQTDQSPSLTRDQMAVWETVAEQIQKAASGKATQPILLHGVTGSGKTEIYLKAVEKTLETGRQAIILVPEIAITPQTVRRFASRFPGVTGLAHSNLSTGERYDTWRRARQGKLAVVIGPRSALFTPFPNIGLIIIDECHEDSYYQADIQPYYHAAQAAVIYSRLVGAVCLMGSATPNLTTTYQASQGRIQYLHLPERILAHRQTIDQLMEKGKIAASRFQPLEGEANTIELPPVEIVDMRQELQSGNRSIFSQALQTALAQVLENRQQAILFLNRRGTATYVFCRNCGFVLKCPRCDLPLTYHIETGQDNLICHHCWYQRKLPPACPDCGSRQIRHYGTGTERVETELLKLYPEARALRWDYETTRKKGAHAIILGHFAAGRADILIGTQMIAKGLDLPLVTLVGVVLADVGLNLPDYRAAERAFQVLTQVAGRAGRSPLGGQVILQTFQPDHYVIQAASRHSYREFYRKELEYRRRLKYPPFSQLVRLEVQHQDNQQAERAARQMAQVIHNWIKEANDQATEMIGPSPCFFQRLAGRYRWQIILRGPDPINLLRNRPLPDWKIETNPPNLL